MSLIEKYIKGIRFLLPSPFSIALLLTLFAIFLALIWPNQTLSENQNWLNKLTIILNSWNDGLWNVKGLAFAIQMMLMLLLGHVLALSKPVDSAINQLLPFCSNNARSALIITFFTLTVSWFNWGLGLVFGAVFCKKIMNYAAKSSMALNHGLIGACGYSGLMIWHGGISGSSLVKIAERGHLTDLAPESVKSNVPELIDFSKTVFSNMNIAVTFSLLVALPITMYLLGKKTKVVVPNVKMLTYKDHQKSTLIGIEKFDHSKFVGLVVGFFILLFCGYLAISHPYTSSFQFINPNYLNLTFLGLALVLHGKVYAFLKAIEKAIVGTAGILIQFPLYFGIMGIVSETGIISDLAAYFQSISTNYTYPIFTFLSAGMVNFFVPSGGGQWYIQGPLIIQSAVEMEIPLNKSIMAMAYGDQLTNMMQPFWALPLLGITGLKVKDILPYTLIMMVVGFIIFTLGLLIF
ncbi:MAG: short-chain fatty acid transporter [Crocinitomicaceae bacterium]|nr:short-chain fatty acid transporter [Crocinitomicaceae bacterium]